MLHIRLFIILSLVIASTLTKAAPVLVESIVAIVNNKPILLSEFNQMWQTFRNSLKNVDPKEINTLKQRTLDQLILLDLQLSHADKLGIRVNQRELKGYVEQIAQANQLSLKQLYARVAQQGQTAEQFRKNIRHQATIRRLQQQLLASPMQISPKKIENELAKELIRNDPHEYQYQILLIENPEDSDKKSQAIKKIKVIQDRLQNKLNFEQAIAIYSDLPLNSNSNLIWSDPSSIPDNFHDFLVSANIDGISPAIQTERGIFLIKLIAKRSRQPIEQTRYQLQQITLSPLSYDKKSAGKIYKLFLETATSKNQEQLLSKLIREVSQDQFAFNQGKTGWLTKRDVPPAMANQLDNVELNQLQFVETNQGWLIYQILKQETFDASRDFLRQQIHQRLLSQEVEKSYATYLRNLRKNSPITILLKLDG